MYKLLLNVIYKNGIEKTYEMLVKNKTLDEMLQIVSDESKFIISVYDSTCLGSALCFSNIIINVKDTSSIIIDYKDQMENV